MLHPNQGFTYNKFEKPNDWPKIDKTFDYKIENGKLLSGNEHIYLSGPVTYTTVGNVKIKDNLASNFSNVNYLRSDGVINYDLNSTDLEVYVVLNNAGYSNIGLRGVWLCELTNSPINISIANGLAPTLQVKTKKSGESTFTQRQSYDFTYATRRNGESHFKLTKIGNVITLKGSNDGIVWSNGTTYTLENDEVILYNSSFTNSVFMLGVQWADAPECNIDLNKTYIKINNNLWFYGKNYATSNMVPVPSGLEYNGTTTPEIGWVYNNNELIKGPINYTKVGNPKIVNGIVSGFSYSNRLNITSNVANSDITEMVWKFKLDASGIKNNYNYIFYKTGGNLQISIYGNTANPFFNQPGIYLPGPNQSYLFTNFLPLPDVWYWVKYTYDGTTVRLYSSTDGTNYTLRNTIENITITGINGVYQVGWGSSQDPTSTSYFSGSIDLNETYIKVNGIPWFGYSSKFQEFTSAPQGTMIGKDDTHSLAVETYQDKGIVDYTIVGSPTIVDGVASGFSGNDYLSLGYNVLPDFDSKFEMSVKFTTGQTITTSNLFGASNYYYNGFRIGDAGKILFSLNVGSIVTATLNYVLSANTTYKAVAVRSGNTITATLYDSANNALASDSFTLTDEQIVTQAAFTNIGQGVVGAFNGSIDLKETYIKVNDQYWFHPYPNSYPKLVGPESYTKVGSPSIINGIITYTSSSDYIQLNDQLTWDGASDLEVYCRFKTPATFTDSNMPVISNEPWSTPFVWIWGDSVYFQLPTTNISVSGVTTNTWYRIKIIGKNNTWTRILYTNDGTELARVTSTESTGTALTMPISIFRDYNGNRPVESVDLNNTYIKVNGALWFGKEDWKPSTYTDNSIYLLAGHKTDYSSYNELDFTPTITNNDTYNVTIDNQEIFTNMSSGTHIEWDKLNLTTGYNITTPSALKAHTIKISPSDNTKHIIGYTCDYDESN